MMDKAAAYRIFELTPDATESDINYRFGILAKRCRSGEGYLPDGMDHPVSFADIEEAYNCLMDIDTRSEADKIEDEDLRNEYIAKQKFLNFWHYNWVKIVIGVFFAAFIIWGLVAMFTKAQSDVHIVFYGEFVDDGKQGDRLTGAYRSATGADIRIGAVTCYIRSQTDDGTGEGVAVQLMPEQITNNESRAQFNSMLAAKEVDIVVTDYDQYKYLVRYGVLLPLEGYMSRARADAAADYDRNLVLEGDDGQEHVYGFNLYGSNLFAEMAGDSKEYIVSLVNRANPNGADVLTEYLDYLWDVWETETGVRAE